MVLKRSEFCLTQIAADLATPRWYAARKAEFGSGSSSIMNQNAKLVNKPLGRK